MLQRFKFDVLNLTLASGRILNDEFSVSDNTISPRTETVFATPLAVFQFLHLLADNHDIDSLDYECIRQLRNARRQFSDKYWVEYPECRTAFMQLMRHPEFFGFGWNVMHLHGILQAYLPQWDNIVGMMQFDLFHAYTVDEHTHRLIKNLFQYFNKDNKDFPRCSNIVRNLDKPELIFIAGIFHDIAKGRGGDHSKLGAADVFSFGESHGLTADDIKVISWLVESHLLMSVVAQRRDIYDPEVVADFASAVKSHNHLNMLYALTLADIRATNDSLWNDWKSSLLKELYLLTQKALDNGLQCQVTFNERALQHQKEAIDILQPQWQRNEIDSVWNRLEQPYFTRFKPIQIAWHTQQILVHEDADGWLIKMANHTTKAGTELLIYGKDRPAVFAQIASVLDNANLSILDANIAITPDGYVFDSIIVVDEDNEKIASTERCYKIEQAILAQLNKATREHHNSRKLSRRLKQLNVPTKVRFFSASDDATLIELEALDTPGLLASIGHVFVDFNLTLRLAKISTIGERAEDVFIVSDEHNHALSPELQLALKKQISLTLDQLETETAL
jgi:[protein-PII] uridylyltransferase